MRAQGEVQPHKRSIAAIVQRYNRIASGNGSSDGFSALAVDIGRIYAERRRVQNEADAAAFAAAEAAINHPDWSQDEIISTSVNQAVLNGYESGEAKNTINITRTEAYVDPDHPNKGSNEFFKVTIWQHVDPIFSQFIFQGNEEFTVESTTRIRHNQSVSAGDLFHTLSTEGDSLTFDGTVGVDATGGNIISNGDGTRNGGGNAAITVSDGDIRIGGTYTEHGNGTITADEIVDGVGPEGIEPVPQPYCPDSDWWDDAHQVQYYVHTSPVGGGTLQPGIHCVKDGIDLTSNNKDLSRTDVLIVMLGGDLKVKGAGKDAKKEDVSNISLTSARDLKDKYGYQYGGMLFYVPESNAATLTLGGNSGSYFQDTIYAPKATCDLGGTAQNQSDHVALICYTAKFHGTTDVSIVYNQAELFRFPAKVDLFQ